MVVTPKNLTGTPTSNSILWQWEAGSDYPLDSISGAVAAFSLKQLKTGATYCVKVRRSSDDETADIGFSGGDLDTTALLNHCGAGDGFVHTWYDQSGNGYNAVDATASRQPQIVRSGIYLGNLETIVDNRLSITHNSAFNIATEISIFYTSTITTTGTNCNTYPIRKAAAWITIEDFTRQSIGRVSIDGSLRSNNVGALAVSTRKHITHTYSSTTQDILGYIDGGLEVTTPLSGLSSYTIATNSNTIYVCEMETTSTGGRVEEIEHVLLFNVVLTGEQINTLIDFLDAV